MGLDTLETNGHHCYQASVELSRKRDWPQRVIKMEQIPYLSSLGVFMDFIAENKLNNYISPLKKVKFSKQ